MVLFTILGLLLVTQAVVLWLLLALAGSVPIAVETAIRRQDDRVEKRLARQEPKTEVSEELVNGDTPPTGGDIVMMPGVSYRG